MANYINYFHSDKLFNDQIINSLLAPNGYSAPHRDMHPYQLFRMELLKILKSPEISYRKFCTDEYFGKERKQNRRFVRLPLNTKTMVNIGRKKGSTKID